VNESSTVAGRNSHPLHAGERIWRESNCYVDLWIGLLHHLGLDPSAMLACAVAPHFEGDQWTFCKPSATEIASLYGVRVEELTVWRGMREHVTQQVARGRVVLLEVDGFYLPDTHGVTYRVEHHKTTIGIHAFEPASGVLSYFHNAGMYSLDGADLDGILATSVSASALPPFVEVADPARRHSLEPAILRARSMEAARARLALASERNPFLDWADAADAELDALAGNALCYFHAWAFAAVRQAGAMAELLAAWCAWMSAHPEVSVASAALRELSQTLAAQQFRLARLPSGGKRPDFAGALRRCAVLWENSQLTISRMSQGTLHDPPAESTSGSGVVQRSLPLSPRRPTELSR
jgi:hypothetical protein